MKPSDVLGATVLGGSLIGVAFMALGGLMLSAASNAGNSATTDLFAGSVLFAAGAAFLLVSLILIPALRAIQRESPQRP